MKNRIKWWAVAAMLAAFCAPAWANPVQSIQNWVEDWASQLGKPLVWEAGPEYSQVRVSWDRPIHAGSIKEFEIAFDSLRLLIERAQLEPLVACVYPNAIVVSRASQPCGAPSREKDFDKKPPSA